MKKLTLGLSLLLLVFSIACGNGGTGVVIGTGHYSNASLNGTYVYQISGWDEGNGVPYRESGYFVTAGNGTITNGTDDFTEFGSALGTITGVTGTISISKDGTGTIAMSTGINLFVTLRSSSKVDLMEADPGANAIGGAELQDATASASAPTGSYVFRLHTLSNAHGSSAVVGKIATSGGVISALAEDVNRAGTFTGGLTLSSGSFNAPTNGRGTGTFTDSSSAITDFVYYIVDANHVRLLWDNSLDTSTVGQGSAELQSTFSGDALTGNSYAFGSQGDDTLVGGVKTVGAFSASSGAITAGAYDSVVDFTPNLITAPIAITGTYTWASSGRAVVTLDTVDKIFWMVSPSRGFFLTSSPAAVVEDGTADIQSGTFTNASLNGQYAYLMQGFDNTPEDVTRGGWIQWDGSGNLKWNDVVNDSASGNGATGAGTLSGTYVVSSTASQNGRTTASVNNLSNNLVFYPTSSAGGYMLQLDAGTGTAGHMTLQQ